MSQTSKAKAAIELDALCDEYERAYKTGTDSSRHDIEPWLDRVAPERRSWLRDELVALRADLESSPDDRLPEPLGCPEGVGADVWAAIAGTPTFQRLSAGAQIALARGIQSKTFTRGSHLIRAGQPAAGLLVITSGHVEITTGVGSQRQHLDQDGPGGVLGEMSLLTGHLCAADVIATTPVTAFVLTAKSFEDIRTSHPEIEIALSQLLSDRLGHRSQDALCGKSLGGYLLETCVSSGAMGVVYRARRESDQSVVALKMLRHRFIYDANIVSRFEQEAKFLTRLEHPNIVAIRDHFIEYRTRFIVLDYYDGLDLREVIHRVGKLSEPTVRAVLGQIAAGLRYAHQCGVLHLDLKPANILINRNGNVAITDFGLGRLIQSDGCDQQMVGTPLYMPPEQFTMSDLGPHSDWYAFGCIAYELLTGERLFDGGSTLELMRQKSRVPDLSWPGLNASGDLRLYLTTSLQPMLDHRDLALDEIATWARRVPELAISPDG